MTKFAVGEEIGTGLKKCRGKFSQYGGCLKMKFHKLLCCSFFFKFDNCSSLFGMAEETPEGTVRAYSSCKREIEKLHALIRELRMSLFKRYNMVPSNFSQSSVTFEDIVAVDDVIFLAFLQILYQMIFLDLQ